MHTTLHSELEIGQTDRLEANAAHKRSLEHLWLDHITADTPDCFSVEFKVPSQEREIRLADLIEVQRQCGIVYGHRHLGVPEDDVFSLVSISFALTGPTRNPGPLSARGTVHARLFETQDVRGRPRSADVRFHLIDEHGGEGRGAALARFVPRHTYDRLRSRRVRPASHATEITCPPEVEIIRADRSDRVLADHDSDHVTAMAMLCAIESSLAMGTGSDPRRLGLSSLSMIFTDYLNADPPPTFAYLVSPGGSVDGHVAQSEARRAEFSGTVFEIR
ncbi:hypothetical protein [Microbacterium aurugineum]